MQCFAHPSTPAVAVCKHCAKGLCLECCTDTGFGISCQGACEGEVKMVRELLQRSQSVYQKTASVYLRAFVLYVALALVFFGLVLYFRDTIPREVKFLLVGGGTVFLLGGIFNVVNAKKMKPSSANKALI